MAKRRRRSGKVVSFKAHGKRVSFRAKAHRSKPVPKHFRKWAAAAKACADVGRVGSKSKVACMRKHVRRGR